MDLFKRSVLLFGLVAPFLTTLYAIYHLNLATARDVFLLVGMYTATALGITVGYHRMLTHRSFRTSAVVRFVFLALGSMAIEGPAMRWAAMHLKHHANTDKEGDPHSPWAGTGTGEDGYELKGGVLGLFHSHIGWMFTGAIRPCDEIYLQRIRNDKAAVLASYTFPIWAVLGMLIPYWIGGVHGFVWGGLVRLFFVHHVTWSVNSVCHVFGRRPFDTLDRSRNNLLVSWLALGEGSHNTHHAYPASARQGLEWWEMDLSYFVIWALERARVVWDVKRIPARSLRERQVAANVAAAVLLPADPSPIARRKRAEA